MLYARDLSTAAAVVAKRALTDYKIWNRYLHENLMGINQIKALLNF